MKTFSKKLIAVVIAVTLLIGVTSPASASFQVPSDTGGYVAMMVGITTLGDGLLYEPRLVPFEAGENWAQVTARFLGTQNFTHTGNIGGSSFYMSSIRMPRDITLNVPQALADHPDSWA